LVTQITDRSHCRGRGALQANWDSPFRIARPMAGFLVEHQHVILARHQLAELVAQGTHLSAVGGVFHGR
jgi:hypothetical protein